MKFKDQVSLYGGGAGAITLVAILASIHEQLITVGPWVLDTILASLGSLLLYGGFQVFIAGRKHWLTMREQEQALVQSGERHKMEMLALRADIHAKLSRVYADPNGNYPVLLPGQFVTPAEIGGNVLMLPPGQAKGIGGHVQIGEVKPSAQEQVLQIPVTSSFRSVMSYIQGEQVVLACDHQGVVLGTVLDWLSTLVVGMPGMGKSTALYFFIAQLMLLSARFQVLDPHASLVSLKDLLPYVNRTDACIQTAPLIEDELERRMDRYEANGGVCQDQHYMVIVDELPAIADREQQLTKAMEREERRKFRSLIDVLRRVVCEGRKYHMYCMIVGQSIPATILPTIARDNMSSRYVFNCSADHARMAGLDGKSIESLLPALENNVGRCIVAAARMKAFLGAIPRTSVDDLRYVIETTGYQREGWQTVDADPEPMETLRPKPRSIFDAPTRQNEQQDAELARGIEVYQNGAKTLDAFWAAMGYETQHQARLLWARVKARVAA